MGGLSEPDPGGDDRGGGKRAGADAQHGDEGRPSTRATAAGRPPRRRGGPRKGGRGHDRAARTARRATGVGASSPGPQANRSWGAENASTTTPKQARMGRVVDARLGWRDDGTCRTWRASGVWAGRGVTVGAPPRLARLPRTAGA